MFLFDKYSRKRGVAFLLLLMLECYVLARIALKCASLSSCASLECIASVLACAALYFFFMRDI